MPANDPLAYVREARAPFDPLMPTPAQSTAQRDITALLDSMLTQPAPQKVAPQRVAPSPGQQVPAAAPRKMDPTVARLQALKAKLAQPTEEELLWNTLNEKVYRVGDVNDPTYPDVRVPATTRTQIQITDLPKAIREKLTTSGPRGGTGALGWNFGDLEDEEAVALAKYVLHSEEGDERSNERLERAYGEIRNAVGSRPALKKRLIGEQMESEGVPERSGLAEILGSKALVWKKKGEFDKGKDVHARSGRKPNEISLIDILPDERYARFLALANEAGITDEVPSSIRLDQLNEYQLATVMNFRSAQNKEMAKRLVQEAQRKEASRGR